MKISTVELKKNLGVMSSQDLEQVKETNQDTGLV